MKAPSDGDAGFSMLEMLITLALTAFIVGALATMAGQWLPSWDRGMARMQRVESLSAGAFRLIDDLAAAEWVTSGGAEDRLAFDGAESQATFVRTAIGPNTHSSLQIVHVAPVMDKRGMTLTRTAAPFAIDPAGLDLTRLAFASPVAYFRAPYRGHFAYQGEDRQWRNQWRGQKNLPYAVRVVVTDASGKMVLQAAALVGAQAPASCVAAKSMSDCQGLMAGKAPAPAKPTPAVAASPTPAANQ